ncbi:hypothetical protein D9756_004103 [Leucocoprinus leucothites]|uniref:F-box domain-containing protein n=1 Tax=Leucocoprinus leucothites TaxID=201217 RepID=A0A8H5G0D7_9AGAR|nr:hypothetical protein D9756_004103 [Leucoagaricus leucothites]
MLPHTRTQLQLSTGSTPEDWQVAERLSNMPGRLPSFEETILSKELEMLRAFASPLLTLPLELIDRVLCNLDLRSLLKCKGVCKKLKERVEHAKSIQYIMELDICGQEMNPNNDWSVADSFKSLRQYQSAWEQLEGPSESTSPIVVPMKNGGLWELYGGVLAQSDEDGRFYFMRLPSTIRHIKQETWEIIPDIPDIRDFGMDPGQNLLVWITAPTPASPTLSLHLRTLRTAEKHPHARHDIICHDQCTHDGRWHYSIKIMQDYIGLWAFFRPWGDADPNLKRTNFLVWNWKEGQLELDISTPYTQSFTFASNRHVVLADRYDGPFQADGPEETEAYLTLIDFKAEGATQKSLDEVKNAIKLRYPTRAQGASYRDFDISSEPAPGWTPGKDDRTPFYVAKENRVFTVTITAEMEGGRDLAFYHFIPWSVFRGCLNRLDTSQRRELVWSEWAPAGTRLLRTSAPASSVWVCFTFGFRCIASVFLKGQGDQGFTFAAHIYDFNQLSLQREQIKGGGSADNCKTILETSKLKGQGTIWADIVETSLPFRRFTKPLLVRPWPSALPLMCTADHIVLVDMQKKEYSVFTV